MASEADLEKTTPEEYEEYLYAIGFYSELKDGIAKLLQRQSSLPDNPFYDLKRILQHCEQRVPLKMHKKDDEEFVGKFVAKIENEVRKVLELSYGKSMEIYTPSAKPGFYAASHVARWIDIETASVLRELGLSFKTHIPDNKENYKIHLCLTGEAVYGGSFCPSFTSCTLKELHTLSGYSLVEALNEFVNRIIEDITKIYSTGECKFLKVLLRSGEYPDDGASEARSEYSDSSPSDYARIKEHVRHDDFEEFPFSEEDSFFSVTDEMLMNSQWLFSALKSAIETGRKISLMCFHFDNIFDKDLLRINKEYCVAAFSTSGELVGHRTDDIIHDLYSALFFSKEDCQGFMDLYTKLKTKASFMFSPFTETMKKCRRQAALVPERLGVQSQNNGKWYYFLVLFVLSKCDGQKGSSKPNTKKLIFELYHFMRSIEVSIVQYLQVIKNITLNLDKFFVKELKQSSDQELDDMFSKPTCAKPEDVESLLKVFEFLLLRFARKYKSSTLGLIGATLKNKLGRMLSSGENLVKTVALLKNIRRYISVIFDCLFFETLHLFDNIVTFLKSIGSVLEAEPYVFDINRHEKIVDMEQSLAIFQNSFPDQILVEATLLQYCQDSGISVALQHILSRLFRNRQSEPLDPDLVHIPLTDSIYENPFPFLLLYFSVKSQQIHNFRLNIDEQAIKAEGYSLSQSFNDGVARLTKTLLFTLKQYKHIKGFRHILYATDFVHLEMLRQDGSPFNELVRPKDLSSNHLQMKILSALDMSSHNFLYSRCKDSHNIMLKEFYFVCGPNENSSKHLFCSYIAQRCASNKKNSSILYSGVTVSRKNNSDKFLSAELATSDPKDFAERLQLEVDGKSTLFLQGYVLLFGTIYSFKKKLFYTWIISNAESTESYHGFNVAELFLTTFLKTSHAFEALALCEIPEHAEEHHRKYIQALEYIKSTFYSKATENFGTGERLITGYQNLLFYSIFSDNYELYMKILRIVKTNVVQTFMYFSHFKEATLHLITKDAYLLHKNTSLLESVVHNIEIWAERVERFVCSPGLTAFSSLQDKILHQVKEALKSAKEIREDIAKDPKGLNVVLEVMSEHIQSTLSLLACCETANMELFHLHVWESVQPLLE